MCQLPSELPTALWQPLTCHFRFPKSCSDRKVKRPYTVAALSVTRFQQEQSPGPWTADGIISFPDPGPMLPHLIQDIWTIRDKNRSKGLACQPNMTAGLCGAACGRPKKSWCGRYTKSVCPWWWRLCNTSWTLFNETNKQGTSPGLATPGSEDLDSACWASSTH
ncbi:hypothetical protein RRG08_063218 [Elysia crispata]|uniref:Uncharacterized protein n=1 Tax=Elysia crispata TaxID=231223 RepID=A0AAE0Y9E5_9GAST|nr:hypothetical protein RRG08_063218 [Elysia crispata]